MTYCQPNSLFEALGLIQGAEVDVIAGGTDFYPALSPGKQPDAFLDITRIDGLADISEMGDTFLIGAAATWTDVITAELPPAFDALKQAAREVGSVQIQNAGTVAGNICNASPAADGVPPLLALDAQVKLASAARGTRVLPLQDFITGVRETVLAPDELVTGIIVPRPPAKMVSGFEKLGSRRYLVISIAMTAANVVLDPMGRIAEARIAVGSCSAVAQRLVQLEASLLGQMPGDLAISDEHLAPLSPIDDVRGSAAYRFEAARHQIACAVQKAAS